MRLALSALALVLAVGSPAFAQGAPQSAGIELKTQDGAAAGSAVLRQGPEGTLMRLTVSGMTPGWHGLHFHMVGDCSDGGDGFKKSGAHVGHGDDDAHGLLNPEGPEDGDLPNIYVAADGTGNAEFYMDDLDIADLRDADGSALVVHANEDDHTSQPIGNAGDRVACGVVGDAR